MGKFRNVKDYTLFSEGREHKHHGAHIIIWMLKTYILVVLYPLFVEGTLWLMRESYT